MSDHIPGSKKDFKSLRQRFPDKKSEIDSTEKAVRSINKKIFGAMSPGMKKEYTQSNQKNKVASKMGKVTPSRIEAMERAYKDKGRSVPLRYHVAAKKQSEK